MLATALYCWNSSSIFVTKINKGLFFLIFALSTKIFTLFSLLSLKWRKKSLIIILWIGLSFSFISIPAFWNEPRHSPIALLYSWNEAASSAGKALNPIEVRGRRNPSLPGLILRLAHVPPERSKADVLTAFMICALVALIWRKLSANFSARTSWLSWLAITPAIHPLPWWHLYILTFPLAMIVVNQSIKFKNRKALFLATLSIFLIGCSTETFLGQIGVFLEITLAKTWGTLLLLHSLLLLNKKTSF